MNFATLVQESYRIADAHGWHEGLVDGWDEEKLVLLHSEISEALEEYRVPNALLMSWATGSLGPVLYESGYAKDVWQGVRVTDEVHRFAGCPRHQNKPHKPAGFVVELADLVIRAADLIGIIDARNAETLGLGKVTESAAWWVEMSREDYRSTGAHFNALPIPTVLNRLHGAVSKIRDAGDLRVDGAGLPHLGFIVAASEGLAARVGGDLWAAIEVKSAFNETREFRHGGKRA